MSDRARPGDAEGNAPSIARAYDQWAERHDADVNVTRDLDARVGE